MKRIIFSLYRNDIDNHRSANSYKREQFEHYKNFLENNHKEYAFLCKADYELFTDIETDYDTIQFQKIQKLKELSKYYDEVLYLDFDVITNTNESFFEKFDLNNICAYGIEKKHDLQMIMYFSMTDTWDPMDMYSKACCKNAMLFLDRCKESDVILNTGVIGANKKSSELINFDNCDSLLNIAKEDNNYPIEMSKIWKPNNEVYLSYIIERYNLPFTNIGLQWNFILDDKRREYSPAAHFYHCVNKDFNLVLSHMKS